MHGCHSFDFLRRGSTSTMAFRLSVRDTRNEQAFSKLLPTSRNAVPMEVVPSFGKLDVQVIFLYTLDADLR